MSHDLLGLMAYNGVIPVKGQGGEWIKTFLDLLGQFPMISKTLIGFE